jgi:hypothetical protein
MRAIVSCYWIVAASVACGGRAFSPSGAEEPADESLTQKQQVEAVLERFCGSCHGAEARASGNVMGSIDYIEDIDRLAEEGFIIPLDAERSPIIRQMRDGSMPPERTRPRPTSADISVIAEFIDFPAFYGLR